MEGKIPENTKKGFCGGIPGTDGKRIQEAA
jgi:hypothetical protein